MRSFPQHTFAQCGVFTGRQAASDGWTRPALRWAVHSRVLEQPRRGTYRVCEPLGVDRFEYERWSHAAPAIAAALMTPGAMASHSAAAVLHRLPLAFTPSMPCVTVVPWHTGEIGDVHVHRTTAEELALPVGAAPCLSIARTVVDMAREHGVAAGVVPLDYALHNNFVTMDEVQATLDHCYRWPGVRAARAAAAASDGRSESVLESLSRLKIIASGIEAPEPQRLIGDASGRPIARVDFYWDRFGVVGEADGLMKYDLPRDDADDRNPLQKEKIRQELLERLGLTVVRWMTADLADFDPVVHRIRNAFRSAARRPAHERRRWTVLNPL